MYGLNNVVYHNSAKHVKEVANKIGATQDEIVACGDDLRQLQLAVMLKTSGALDKAPHVF